MMWPHRSEEHTSELQSRGHLVCRLLLEKKKAPPKPRTASNKTQKLPLGRTNPSQRALWLYNVSFRFPCYFFFFFFNDTATTEIYTLSLHDALPITHHFACVGRSVFSITSVAGL